MRASRPLVILVGFLVVSAIIATRADMRSAFGSSSAAVNSPPVAGDDTYARHGNGVIGPLLQNDSDPDGDPMTVQIVTFPTHGNLFGLDGNSFSYQLTDQSYTGTDSFTYKACDNNNACSGAATVTINIVNQAPVARADTYTVHGVTTIGPMFANDFDPDGDQFNWNFVTAPSHGTMFGLTQQDLKRYTPEAGYTGSDSFTYKVCDQFGLCSPPATVTLYVIGDGSEDGVCDRCNKRVGSPVNITNGNMYLQQDDYQLPSVGYGLNLTRTYNSNQHGEIVQTRSLINASISAIRVGLFGRGWSSTYDESIIAYDNNLLRFNQADGRAIYFGRPVGASGAFTDVVGDFHAQLTQTGSGFTLLLKDGSVQQFSTDGKLVSLADRNGNATALTYGGNGFLSSVTDPFGRVLSLATNANGQVVSIADSIGTIASYTYGLNNELLTVTYADNSSFTFVYDGNIRLTAVTDALGNIIESHIYDAQGRALTSEKHGGVEHYNFNYVSATQTDVMDGLGRTTKYTFDTTKGRNVVTRVEGQCSCGNSQVQQWTYDSQLNITSQTDALGHVKSYTYDPNGNRLTETDASGTITYTYNGFSEVLTRANQLNGVTTNTYDAQGNLLTTTDALNKTTTFTYNARGQMLTAMDARGKTTSFAYDANGNLTERMDANDIITFLFYDARGRLTKVRDGLSRETLYAYDAYGRINKVTHPDNSFMTFTYDQAGRRTRVTDERGNPTNYAYDGAYRLTSVTDAANLATSYGYDLMSNPTSMTDALSRMTNYEYDDFNRVVRITYPPAALGATRLFEVIVYDAAGNVTSRTDTAGRVSSYAYDNVDRLTSTTDAANKTTGLQYDALSRVTSLTDAINQQYQFAYDALGRQTQITRAGVSMSYAYDAVGNRIQRTDYNGTVTNYSYDNLDRLTTIIYPSRTATYSYDPLNNLTRATNENGSVWIGYDDRYRVNSFEDPFLYGITYHYDAVGNRTKLSVNDTTYATYTYDAVNRLTNLKDAANQSFPHSYDAVNRLTARSAPNGVSSSYAYDGLDRLTALNHTAGGNTLIGNQYTYNDANNITSWTNASGNHAYGFDLVDRLTSATNSAQPNENYSYDSVGNRTTSHVSATYNYQPFNKLTNTATATYSYDNNGNLLSKTEASGTTTFSWNEENQLTQVSLPNGVSVNYKYDALGRRIQRTTTAGANERYVYDGRDVLLDLNADWSVATTYLNGPGIDNHLRQTNSVNGMSYYLTDHLDSTAALTDVTGSLVEQETYDSFGNSPGSARTRYGFTGRERDPETGQLYYRARFYDAQAGRFISEDPIGLTGGINPYAYVANNPIKFIDPEGLMIWLCSRLTYPP